jgi:hypothetical protein
MQFSSCSSTFYLINEFQLASVLHLPALQPTDIFKGQQNLDKVVLKNLESTSKAPHLRDFHPFIVLRRQGT